MRTAKWIVGLCVLANVAALVVFAQDRSVSANTDSRIATIDSLVTRGTYFIGQSRYARAVDKVQVDGNFLSSKPPMLPTITAGFYWLFTRATGITFANNEAASITFVSLVSGLLPHLFLLFYLYRFLLLWVQRPAALALGFVALSFNYLGLGYATGMNNHTPAAAVTFISFYYAYLLHSGRSGAARHWILSGLLAGLAPTLEPWAAVFSVSFTIYLATLDVRKTLGLFIPAAVPVILLNMGLTYVSSGSVVPVYFREHLYLYPGSYWIALVKRELSTEQLVRALGPDGLLDSKPVMLFHMTFGHHGLFSLTPVFILALWSMIRAIRRSGERAAEALAILLPLVAVLAILLFNSRNYGGVCVGLRWLIFAMPLLFLFVAAWLDEVRSGPAIALFAVLFLIGLLTAAEAVPNPWRRSRLHQQFLPPPASSPAATAQPSGGKK